MKKMLLSSSSCCFKTTIILLLLCLVTLEEVGVAQKSSKVSRDDFPSPPNFVFGSGSSAYQVEGAAKEDGRTPSIWDTFAYAGNTPDKSNGDIACDEYHKYKEDIQLMADTGFEAYRFSISWSRLIPNGRGPVNPKGVEFYNNVIDELVNHGIQPHVTLYHYDLPQALEDEYAGWLSRNIVKDFTAYADVCFREFGDRVSHWTTVNEANVVVLGAYDAGIFPPKRCSSPFGVNCTAGNSTSEPYIASHNFLLAHASAARLYKRKYQVEQRGLIGFNVFAYYFIPLTNATEDVIATRRAYDFYVGLFVDPLVYGDYPSTVKKNVGSRLPYFTEYESEQVKGSYDFLGLNHYSVLYVKDDPDSLNSNQRDLNLDMAAKLTPKAVETTGGPVIPDELPCNPFGMQGVLEYFKQVYGNPPLYIHENGQKSTIKESLDANLNDTSRVTYLDSYISSVLDAVRNGSNTKGYFSWSFLDAYELFEGYEAGYGLYYIDRKDPGLKRYPKLSAHWYSSFLKGGGGASNTIIDYGTISEANKIFSAQIQTLHATQ